MTIPDRLMERHVEDLVFEIEKLKALLEPGGEFHISRTDGAKMGIGDIMQVGGVFARIDLLIEYVKGGKL